MFTGFHMDDLIGRFIFSDRPGAERLYRIYSGGYGAANGNPGDAAWMMEEGYAPWWMDQHVLLSFYRPISLVTHLLDAALWPSSAVMWHIHSLLWFGVLLWCTTRAYRSIQGQAAGGLAALLYALDHTHALPVGFITNRYILIATALCMLTLQAHHEGATAGAAKARWLAPLWYGLSLFAGESSVAIVGYLLSYALFVDTRPVRQRALSLVPYFVVSLGWRTLYTALGHGARGSDLYIDPAREPARFALAALARGPALLLGQWLGPPAETYTYLDDTSALAVIAFAWIFTIALALALWPLVRRDRIARFWAAGMVIAIAPMCAGEPHNRMLFVASIGAAGLIAQWWQTSVRDALDVTGRTLGGYSRVFGAAMVRIHIFVAAPLVAFNAVGLIFFDAVRHSFNDVGPEAVGREAVFLTSPDYFAVRLMKMSKAVDNVPGPARWRTLGIGPEQTTVTRAADKTLVLDYEGGALHEASLTKASLDLYRSVNNPMQKGQTVDLQGLHIEVLEVTGDGRPRRVAFNFAQSLDSPGYRFYNWADNHFHEFAIPAVGDKRVLPKAFVEAAYGT
jgi:hypothetical protein